MVRITEKTDFISLTKDFVQKNVIEQAKIHDFEDSYPHEIVKTMKEMDFFGLTISKEYGGLGLDKLTYVKVVEELAKGWASVPGLLNSHLIVATLIEKYGTSKQKEYLPKMAKGEIRAAILLTEPTVGSDLKALKSIIDKDKLNGQKAMITNGRESDLYAVLVIEDEDFSIYLIESSSEGVTVSENMKKLGFRGIEAVRIDFKDVVVTEENRIGERGLGIKQFLSSLEFGRLSLAASALGVAQASYEYSIQYAKERVAYGNPIAQLPTVQSNLAKMYSKILATRHLIHGMALSDANHIADFSVVKYYASEMAVDVTQSALRIIGGYGYFKEYPIERYIRDALIYVVGEGANEALLTSIGKQLIKEHSC